MRAHHPVVTAALVTMAACGGTGSHRGNAAAAREATGSRSVVGRWALLSLSINGVDRPIPSATNPGSTVYYTFSADGRFRIVHGDSVRETGAWLVETSVTPAYFDHIPDVNGQPGPYVPGIFAIDGDTLRISIVAPNPARRHPTQFHSSATDSSWLLVMARAGS